MDPPDDQSWRFPLLKANVGGPSRGGEHQMRKGKQARLAALIFASLGLAVGLCRGQGAAHEAPHFDAALKLSEQEERDSYEIYSMLLRQDAVRVRSPILGIRCETSISRPGDGEPLWPEPIPEQRKTYQSLIDDFKRRNARPLVLEEKFDLPSYRLLTSREVKEIGKTHPPVPPPPGTPWPSPEDPLLEGIEIVQFLSAVGFSPDHQRALVYLATWTGGRYYFLVKRHGKWITDKDYRGSVCSWVV